MPGIGGAWSRGCVPGLGVCLVQGSTWSWGGAWSQGGVPGRGGFVPGPGGVLLETPPKTATAAGGTHPTGMHSCPCLCLFSVRLCIIHLNGLLSIIFLSITNPHVTF